MATFATTHDNTALLSAMASSRAASASGSVTDGSRATTGTEATSFLGAFKAAASLTEEELAKGSTWNGDVNWANMGSDVQAALLELDNKAVRGADISAFQADLDTVFSRINGIPSDKDRAFTWTIFFRWLFHLRKIRGLGKGERALFVEGLLHVFDTFNNFMVKFDFFIFIHLL